MATPFHDSLDADVPPAEASPPLAALWWLKKGGLATGPEWERAHDICQSREGHRAHDLVHALAHLIEGDEGNAAYWYRRANARRGPGDLDAEWARIVEEVGSVC